MPVISVVMPVYNCERYLRTAVQSILDQSFTDFELLLIDDGSKDRTLEICHDFARRDDRVMVVSDGRNLEPAARSNQGIAMSRGKYIARMDGDDISREDRFQREYEILEADPNMVLVGSWVTLIDPDGEPLREVQPPTSHEALDAALMRRGRQLIYNPSTMIRKDALEKIGLGNEKFPYTDDLDIFLRLAEVGRIMNIDEPLVKYRQHFQSIGFTRWREQEEHIDEILRNAYQRRAIPLDTTEWVHHRRFHVSKASTLRTWAWWALMSGNVRTARKYTLRAMKVEPWNRGNLKLAYCSLRGR